ncbi:MAG: BatD family protein, partial [Chitinophagaceae bacterium]
IRRVQLLPLQEGNLQLGIATVESNIQFINTDVSGKPVVKNERVIVSNSPMGITVLPLPTKNKPIDFSGAIGEFTIQASVTKQNDSVNSNNILQITIKGVGNFGSVLCPTIQWPKGIEAFETETSEQLNKLHFPVEGRKVFRIPFTCLQKGKISIPSIGFTFFSPTIQAYEKIASEPIHLLVDKELEKVAIEQLSSEVSNTKYIGIIGIIALLALFGLMYFFKMNDKQAYANEAKEKEIHTPTNSLPNKENILDINELIDALNYETTDEKFVQKLKSIASELFNQQEDEAKKSMLTELIEECNVALYTPNAIIDRTGLLEKIKASL